MAKSAVTESYDAMFRRSDGKDVRNLPKVRHPGYGKLNERGSKNSLEFCFDWGPGMWPQSMIEEGNQ